jgi:hypothetical protein
VRAGGSGKHFRSVGIPEVEAFVTGKLPNAEAEVAVVHAAAGAMEDIRLRADFEVYFNKFLQSLNLTLPHEAGHGLVVRYYLELWAAASCPFLRWCFHGP